MSSASTHLISSTLHNNSDAERLAEDLLGLDIQQDLLVAVATKLAEASPVLVVLNKIAFLQAARQRRKEPVRG